MRVKKKIKKIKIKRKTYKKIYINKSIRKQKRRKKVVDLGLGLEVTVIVKKIKLVQKCLLAKVTPRAKLICKSDFVQKCPFVQKFLRAYLILRARCPFEHIRLLPQKTIFRFTRKFKISLVGLRFSKI